MIDVRPEQVLANPEHLLDETESSFPASIVVMDFPETMISVANESRMI